MLTNVMVYICHFPALSVPRRVTPYRRSWPVRSLCPRWTTRLCWSRMLPGRPSRCLCGRMGIPRRGRRTAPPPHPPTHAPGCPPSRSPHGCSGGGGVMKRRGRRDFDEERGERGNERGGGGWWRGGGGGILMKREGGGGMRGEGEGEEWVWRMWRRNVCNEEDERWW